MLRRFRSRFLGKIFDKNIFARRRFWELAAVAAFIAGGAFFFWVGSLRMPDFNSFEDRKVESSTKIYDRTGTVLLYDVHSNIRRTVIASGDMGTNIKNATVAIEDSEFYQHKGIKPTAILRSVIKDIMVPFTGGNYQGGSTITQQVIKNALLTTERSITRKVKEWILAIELEQLMSKDEILAIYLNESPYGGNIYGIAEASRMFFGKEPRDLTIAESAYLAALPQAPTHYSPYGNNRSALDNRARYVLKRMNDLGFITEDEYASARGESVTFLPAAKTGTQAMHFVLFVRDYLEQKYGRDMLDSGGLKITTTIDAELQAKAEEMVNRYALSNEKNFNAENAGLVAVDPKTGQILVMVGSRDYFDEAIDGNFNIAIAHRQPGSAFKPFVYATAFMKGYTPQTVLFDVPTEFQTTCGPDGRPLYGTSASDCYMPENYDFKYRGPISLREALAQSINVPAIKVLYLSGIKDALAVARDMGIRSLADPERYGLTLVLGGGEVSLLDMTSAYGVFANQGVRQPATGILKVEDGHGNILEEWRDRGVEVIPKDVALQISDILSDNAARAPAFGERSALRIDYGDVASKTGTTNDYRDAWIVGYSPYLAAGAWAGNNDNSPMQKKVAGFIIAPLWNEFMREALKKYPEERFEEPKPIDPSLKPVLRGFWQGNETFTIDTVSGKLATAYTPTETREERSVGNVHTILHWIDKKDPLGPPPARPDDDPQYRLWEAAVQKWLGGQYIKTYTPVDIPSATDDVHQPGTAPILNIIEPKTESLVTPDSNVLVRLSATGRYPLSRVDYFINDLFIGSAKKAPFDFSFSLKDIPGILEVNTLKAVGYDSISSRGEAAVTIRKSQ